MQRSVVSRALYIYRWIYSAVLALCAVLLGYECVLLYRAHAFSRTAVADGLLHIFPVLYTAVFMTVVNLVLALFLPVENEKDKVAQVPHLRLARLRRTKRLDGAALPAADDLKRKRLVNRCCLACGVLLAGACFVWLYVLFYEGFCVLFQDAPDKSHIINVFILSTMDIFVPFTALILVGIFISDMFYDKHLKDEIALYAGAKASVGDCGRKSLFPLTAALIAIGIGLLIWGYCGGGFKDVLAKANNICTECIGLG